MHRLYSELAQYYDDFIQQKDFKAEVDFVLNTIGGKEHPKILELGAGSGCHTSFFFDSGCAVTGLDSSREMLCISKQKCPDAKFINCDFDSKWPAETGDSFDAAVCLGTTLAYIHGISSIANLLDQLEQVLKPNGIFVFDLWKTIGCTKGSCYEEFLNKNDGSTLIRASEWTPQNEILLSKDCFIIKTSDGMNKVVIDEHSLYLYDVFELKTLFENRGWDVSINANFTKQRYSNAEQRAVFVAVFSPK